MSQLAVLFPGQGAQFVGMCADLLEHSPRVQEMFRAASQQMGLDLAKITAQGPEELLNSTAVSQPAIFVVSLAVVQTLEERGAARSLAAIGTAGLSLGEYSALVFVGALSFESALELVVRRGEYMQEACDAHPSGMLSVIGLDWSVVREVVAEASSEGVVAVANVNSERQIVISGEHAALERAAHLAEERGAWRVVPLKVAGAYHSPLMASATKKLRPYLEQVQIHTPKLPFYANVTAQPVSDPEIIRDGLLRQIESPVLWAPTLQALQESGMDSVVEPGPGRVVAGLVKQFRRRLPTSSLLTSDSIEEFLAVTQAKDSTGRN
ncbi:MAG: ACP S-malonyltransferase [Planctomycetota bacterium]